MNIFYAPPSQIQNGFAELRDQEAIHASKVMRVREGDQLVIVDGAGGRYRGPVQRITEESIQIEVEEEEKTDAPEPALILGMGIIKKRDRLEFAVEKAVELGASQICLFRSEHSIKKNVRMDRLETKALSAMKQSLRTWLPDISLYKSFEELLNAFPKAEYLAAHEKVDSEEKAVPAMKEVNEEVLLLVGPEGGFSPREVDLLKQKNAELISLGTNRLRTETAVTAFLSQFL